MEEIELNRPEQLRLTLPAYYQWKVKGEDILAKIHHAKVAMDHSSP